VAGSQAGISISCACGAAVSVPSLSELRESGQELPNPPLESDQERPNLPLIAPMNVFQARIGTIMFSIAAIAVLFAIARAIGAMAACCLLPAATEAIILSQMWLQCRAEGRPVSEADRETARRIFVRVGLPCSGLLGIVLFLVFP